MNSNYLYSGLIALVVSLTCFGVVNQFNNTEKTVRVEHISKTPASQAVYTRDANNNLIPLDFTQTAQDVVDAVVHIKSTQLQSTKPMQLNREKNLPHPFRDFFGDEYFQHFGPRSHQESGPPYRGLPMPQVGTGSGVIISEDGYIITNNHVIDNADDIEVTLHDKRTYKAKIVGTDPSTDLALLQIKEKNLPKVAFLDSDQVKIGEWVLAVGNPFSLNSTITAGIVSAKGRNINILKEQYAVEDFIQTDAAINPGNSGGALVNLDGGLIGINTAIASPTGSYSGYGFAIPANIVSKVMEDLIEYGVVQRGVLGITIRTVDGNLAKAHDLSTLKGVYVDSLMTPSAAKDAGVKSGDVIIKVNDTPVNTSPELQGIIARHRPGEQVTLTIERKGKEKTIDVILHNQRGDTTITSKETDVLNVIGAELTDIEADDANRLDIVHGVEVTRLYAGKLKNSTQMREGFIITHVNGKPIKSKKQLKSLLESHTGGVMLEGIYRDIPGEYFYAFGLS